MAKKRGVITPLGNTAGAQEAQKQAAISNINSLSQQLKDEVTRSGLDITRLLTDKFGIEGVGNNVTWTLPSGKQVAFTELKLSYEQVRDTTTVTFDVNGRDQSLLTPESLDDLESMKKQQFYPAVGRYVDDKVDILDGSRRRARFLLEQGNIPYFTILVTKVDISIDDAKGLAKSLQSAKEHTLREIGLQGLRILEEQPNLSQRALCKIMGVSLSKMNRALVAARVDEKLIKLFPNINELTHSDYAYLTTLEKNLGDKLDMFVTSVKEEQANLKIEPAEDMKEATLKLLKLQLSEVSEKKSAVITQPLKKFAKKNAYARKKISSRGFSYEFSRIPKGVQEKLDQAIASVLEDVDL